MDIALVGAGHNGLIAAILLAKAGLKVSIFEQNDRIGGACITEQPFQTHPHVNVSTGAYLLGLMPPELLTKLDVVIPTLKRDPHYFLPNIEKGYLLFGSDTMALKRQFLTNYSEQDWHAYQRLQMEVGALRDDLASSWLEPPLSREQTRDKYIRSELHDAFDCLLTQPIENYLGRFGFKSERVMAMHAVTDAFSGLSYGFSQPGVGHNFLVHNMCRLPKSDGTFMLVEGGMGTVTDRLAQKALERGVNIITQSKVTKINHTRCQIHSIELNHQEQIKTSMVLCNCDPFTMLTLLDETQVPQALFTTIQALKRPGMTLKLNMVLRQLPQFTCLPENIGQYGTTIHLIPDSIHEIQTGYTQAVQGTLPDCPTIEWYNHVGGASAFFVQWVPHEIIGSSWEKEEKKFAEKLLSIADRYAPGTSDLVDEWKILSPKGIEQHFGIAQGHIHHVDNSIGFDQRLPYKLPISGLYSCSAGCFPAGSVIGAAGHNSAQQIIQDLASW